MSERNKYDFITELLDNPKLKSNQLNRLVHLATQEIKSDSSIGADLEKRIKALEENIINIKHGENKPNPLKTNKHYQIKHDPEIVFRILQSFKLHDLNNLFAFKYLVHGKNLEGIDFREYLEKSESDFKDLKNIPFFLYKKIEALLYAYNHYGIDIINKYGCHPFDYKGNITILENHKNKLRALFGGGRPYKPNFYNKFSTAIQNLKKDYRFDDTVGNSEASSLEPFLKNMFKYPWYKDDKGTIHSFSEDKATKDSLFNESQLNLEELKKRNFLVWNPPLKNVFKWISENILKHSNIHGERPFNVNDKKIIFKSYGFRSPRKNENDYIIFEILDKDSWILKEENEFIKYLRDVANDLKSICDLEVTFTTKENKHYRASLLPYKEKLTQLRGGENGLLYKFKFIEKLAYEKNSNN